MKSKITLQDPDKTEIIHITSVEINHTDLREYPEYTAKLKKILRIALGNALDYPYMYTQKFRDQISDTFYQLNKLNINYAVFWYDGSWPTGAEFEERLEECIEEWNKTDWLAAGHIIAHPGKLPKWHQQCVIVNIPNFIKLGKRHVDGFYTNYPSYRQSAEHFHDNYTPHWIGPQSTDLPGDDIEIPINPGKFVDYIPNNILDTLFPYAIINDMMLYNLPYELRRTKRCCYPEDDIEKTIEWFMDNNFPYDMTVEELEEFNVEISSDKQCLKQFKIMDTEIVYITNTESVPKYCDLKAEVISVPCSGLHQFRYASNNIKTLKRIVWADFSPLGIAWTKKLITDWDGRNFEQFFYDHEDWLRSLSASWHPDHINLIFDPELVQEFMDVYGGEDEWIKVWNQIKALDHEFVQVDLMKDWDKLVDVIGKNNRLFIQLSNIWQYEINYINNDIIDAELAFGNLLKNIMINNSKVYFTGDTPADDHYNYIDLDILAEII